MCLIHTACDEMDGIDAKQLFFMMKTIFTNIQGYERVCLHEFACVDLVSSRVFFQELKLVYVNFWYGGYTHLGFIYAIFL